MRHSANTLKNSPRTTRALFVVVSLLVSLLFVAPAAEWEEAWKLGKVILDGLRLDSAR